MDSPPTAKKQVALFQSLPASRDASREAAFFDIFSSPQFLKAYRLHGGPPMNQCDFGEKQVCFQPGVYGTKSSSLVKCPSPREPPASSRDTLFLHSLLLSLPAHCSISFSFLIAVAHQPTLEHVSLPAPTPECGSAQHGGGSAACVHAGHRTELRWGFCTAELPSLHSSCPSPAPLCLCKPQLLPSQEPSSAASWRHRFLAAPRCHTGSWPARRLLATMPRRRRLQQWKPNRKRKAVLPPLALGS